MRRESGNRPCRPEAIPGEAAYAKARASYAAKQRGPAYTGSIATQSAGISQSALPGEDGYVADEEREVAPNGPVAVAPHAPRGMRQVTFPNEDRLSVH
jgi:hypothetical protein